MVGSALFQVPQAKKLPHHPQNKQKGRNCYLGLRAPMGAAATSRMAKWKRHLPL